MCQDCGCGQPGPTRIDGQPAEAMPSPLLRPGPGAASPEAHRHPHSHPHHHGDHEHSHPHSHAHWHDSAEPGNHVHPHDHEHSHGPDPHLESGARVLDVFQPILSDNARLAERNRGFFRALNLLVLNIVSSPGSGKTTLIQKTLERLGSGLRCGVVVGDLETDNDAARLRAAGARAVQITTGTLCHLEAEMVTRALDRIDARSLDLLIIENVGNLVCPAAFDLGEDLRVILLATTEGEDKPLKYPPIFRSAHAVVVTKSDLAGAVEFDRETALANIRRATPGARVFELSAKTGTGMDAWCEYLRDQRASPNLSPKKSGG